jgi:hypothetical protein
MIDCDCQMCIAGITPSNAAALVIILDMTSNNQPIPSLLQRLQPVKA